VLKRYFICLLLKGAIKSQNEKHSNIYFSSKFLQLALTLFETLNKGLENLFLFGVEMKN